MMIAKKIRLTPILPMTQLLSWDLNYVDPMQSGFPIWFNPARCGGLDQTL